MDLSGVYSEYAFLAGLPQKCCVFSHARKHTDASNHPDTTGDATNLDHLVTLVSAR